MMLIEVFEAERSRVKYYYVAAYGESFLLSVTFMNEIRVLIHSLN